MTRYTRYKNRYSSRRTLGAVSHYCTYLPFLADVEIDRDANKLVQVRKIVQIPASDSSVGMLHYVPLIKAYTYVGRHSLVVRCKLLVLFLVSFLSLQHFSLSYTFILVIIHASRPHVGL